MSTAAQREAYLAIRYQGWGDAGAVHFVKFYSASKFSLKEAIDVWVDLNCDVPYDVTAEELANGEYKLWNSYEDRGAR